MSYLSDHFPKLADTLSSIRRLYRRIFSVSEIEHSLQLQWMFGASLLFFYVTFFDWIGSIEMSVEVAKKGTAVCWPFFQNCSDFYFLHALPWGYSQTTFYMVFYAVLMVIIWAMWQKRWTTAHGLMFLLFIWEALVILVFSYQDAAPYGYYHLILTGMLLLVGQKEFFMKLSFVMMYFLAATTKIDSTWIMGTYFTSLKLGLPLFPGWSTALLTNLVMFMQIVGCWFLISERKVFRYIAFSYFLFFHWYSGIFVLYKYPTVSLPAIAILFGPMYRQTPIPFGRKTIGGWIIILLICIFQILGFAAPGDRRITLEGDKFGMFMFEANHQCVITVSTYIDPASKPEQEDNTKELFDCSGMTCHVQQKISHENGLLVRTDRYESASSWNRCYPYTWWSRLHTKCDVHSNIKRIGFTMDHSINGGPFFRIVDAPDMCALTYMTLGPNTWIHSPPEAPIMGYPVQNVYRY